MTDSASRPSPNENHLLINAYTTHPESPLLSVTRRISDSGCNLVDARLSTVGRDVSVTALAVGSWVKSHQNYCAKQGFKFDLVSDKSEAVCSAFGVIKEKTMYGRKVMGIERSTFLIDPSGVIARTWRPVKVPGHAQAVLDELKAAATQ